jgi:ATP-binding protein involved in chromosome partitioning
VASLGDKRPEKINLPGLEPVDRFIVIASGMGGVGKTMVAVDFALALMGLGLKGGLLDADIYGPSVPVMVGRKAHPHADGAEGKLIPPSALA